MARLAESRIGATAFQRILGHHPELLRAWGEFSEQLWSVGLESDLLEQMRRVLARGNGCAYCVASGGPPTQSSEDHRTALATAFAGIVAEDHRAISESQLDVLREEFSEREVVALVAFACFTSGAQMFGSVAGLSPADHARTA